MTNLESLRAESNEKQSILFNFIFLFYNHVIFTIFFLYRIMFLYLGNMYVLVISLLNKINQVREGEDWSILFNLSGWHLVGSIFLVVVIVLICLASLQSKGSPREVSVISDPTNATIIPNTLVTSNITAGKIFSVVTFLIT